MWYYGIVPSAAILLLPPFVLFAIVYLALRSTDRRLTARTVSSAGTSITGSARSEIFD